MKAVYNVTAAQLAQRADRLTRYVSSRWGGQSMNRVVAAAGQARPTGDIALTMNERPRGS